MKGQGPPTYVPPLPKSPIQHPPYTGPNYQGFVFTLPSSSNKPTHYLTIATQLVEGSLIKTAFITGTWQGNGKPMPMSGYITGNGDAIECSWTDPNTGLPNTLKGTLSSYSTTGKLGQVRAQPSAYLEGMVTTSDGTGGPGNVSGEGYGPAPPPPPAIGNEA